MKKVQYKHAHKQNKSYRGITKAICRFCLEKSTFRVISVDSTNHLACTRCLKSTRYIKHMLPIQHSIIKVTKLTYADKIRRTIYRIHIYFVGDHIYGPFNRKRTK